MNVVDLLQSVVVGLVLLVGCVIAALTFLIALFVNSYANNAERAFVYTIRIAWILVGSGMMGYLIIHLPA